MKTRYLAALVAAVSAVAVSPAFASNYGPAPFFNPTVGAPASEQGQNEQTIAAERAEQQDNSAYGGVSSTASESGGYRASYVAPSQAAEPNARANGVDNGH
ncbi:hypothetical protein [Paraburkholderia sp. DHOC27]|uniref:hypothetical protein n=1 Tax=Paraburkholderia sp. DHOC27 TaxID=2303330 RepID=UPI00216AE202|nr:hypothetical protein [Paraburkholderia sp. DHOC27]